jgi:hypothetical protein
LEGLLFHESQVNLADPDDLPMLYARALGMAAVYPQELKRVLIIGLGGGPQGAAQSEGATTC